MKIDIPMPSYSETMEEADLIGWLVAPGDFVQEGDPIAEIETDKATGELESPASGTLVEICVPEGTSGVAVGKVVARLEPAAEDAAQAAPGEPEAAEEEGAEEEPSSGSEASPPPTDETPPAPSPAATAAPVPSAKSADPRPSETPGAPVATPPVTALARRLADRAGLDLQQLEGTGSRGRITKADVEAATTGALAKPSSLGSFAVLDVDCRVDHALDVCQQLSDREPELEIGLRSLILRAAGQALRAIPEVCADDAMAIRLEAPETQARVVAETDRKSLAVLSRELQQDPAPPTTPPTLQVADMGSLGIHRVQYTPAAGVALALGAGAPRSAALEGGPVIATFTLCLDTAAVEIGLASRWLSEFRRRIEEPLEMLL